MKDTDQTIIEIYIDPMHENALREGKSVPYSLYGAPGLIKILLPYKTIQNWKESLSDKKRILND